MNSNARSFTAFAKWMLSSLGVLGLGIVGTAFLLSAHRTSAKVDDLRDQVSRLKSADPEVIVREVRTERLVQNSTASPATASPNLVAGADPVDPTPEGRERHLNSLNETRVQMYRDSFAREASDPAWSRSAEQLLQKTYTAEEFRNLHISTECRATLCRLDLSYPDSESGMTVLKALEQIHPWPGRAFTQVNQQTRTATTYLAREGVEPPDPELAALTK